MRLILTRLCLLAFLVSPALVAQTELRFTGSIQLVACAEACGVCCGSHVITDETGTISVLVGNSLVDLAAVTEDNALRAVSGRLYQAAGQCGVGECSLFLVESVDRESIDEPVYEESSGRLSIDSVVINSSDRPRYRVTLESPFNVSEATALDPDATLPQGSDCSAPDAQCADGTICLSYFGIAGPNGPEFQTCEIPCSHPGAVCPLGQQCATVADGPGQVCIAQ